MNIAKLGESLLQYVPLLSTLVGGPVGGMVVNTILSTLGLTSDATHEDISAALANNPDALSKLKTLEQAYMIQMQTLSNANTADARSREVSITNVTKTNDGNMFSLAWAVVIAFFAFTVLVLFVKVPVESSQMVGTLIGVISTAFGVVLNYYFGSSKGSADKTKLLTADSNTTP